MEDEILRTALAPGARVPVERTARTLRRRRARRRRAGGRRRAHSRLSQVPGGARAAARGDVEQRSRQRGGDRTRRRGAPGATRHGDLRCRSREAIVMASLVSCRHVSSRRRGSCFARRDCRGQLLLLRDRKAPELPGSVTTGDEVTRSLAVGVRGPVGDQAEAPRRFEWLAVDGAVRYRVRLMEVDRREVWSASTSAPGVDLPAPVRTRSLPAERCSGT